MGDFQPTWTDILRQPPNYPTLPTVGKIQDLWAYNNSRMYHRLSPFTHMTGLLSWGTQPFFFTYPDEAGKGINNLKRYESRGFPVGSGPIDIIRVTKFLTSGAGVLFLGKQFLLQTANPYNETRIYNPASPLVAAANSLLLGSVRPQRFVDVSGGLSGIAQSVLGGLGSAIFGEPKVNPPPGTTGANNTDVLPTLNGTTDGKGLIRAGTAKKGLKHLQGRWGDVNKKSGGFFSAIADAVSSMFANFRPLNQPGVHYRSDESSYGLMLGINDGRFMYSGASGEGYDLTQMWVAGKSGGIRKENQYPVFGGRIYVNYDSNGILKYIRVKAQDIVGYTPKESSNPNKPGIRYGDSVGTEVSDNSFSDYTNSDIMAQYKYYSDNTQAFPTKDPDRELPQYINSHRPGVPNLKGLNENLKQVLSDIAYTTNGAYQVYVDDESIVLPTGNSKNQGYDRIFNVKERTNSRSGLNYKLGVLQNYKYTRVVDNSATTNPANFSYKLPTAGHCDAVNTLTVLDKTSTIDKSIINGWQEWSPYADDLIAFFFYDIVNDRYIPFRAAVKGVSETGNALWEELPFIGRADKVYSYGGFNRTLTLTMNVVISSITELAPTWQRINYLTTLIKPGNYTVAHYEDGAMNRFMIPPMVMLTLGDMYKDQPILIQSITTTVPEEASWETLNEFNSPTQWSYLANYITNNPEKDVLYGQLPRTLEVSFGLILLEKERAVVGGANFGHAPRSETWHGPFTSSATTYGGTQTALHQSFVIQDIVKHTAPVPYKGANRSSTNSTLQPQTK